MQQNKLLRYLPMLIVLSLFVTITPRAAFAKAFTAEMIETRDGQTQKSTIYIQENFYRIDVKEDGIEVAIVVNRKTNQTNLINFTEKTFLHVNSNDPKSLSKNPFAAHQYIIKKYNVRSAGTEKIHNLKCDIQEVVSDGTIIMTAWVSRQYNFPLKIVNPAKKYVTQLSKLKDGPIDHAMFKIPSGFTQHKGSQTEKIAPKKKPALSGRLKIDAPVGKRLGPGAKMVVTTNPERQITLILISDNKDPGEIFVTPLNSGNPVKISSLKNTNVTLKKMLDKKGSHL